MIDAEEGKCLYEVLGVAKTAPPADITKAYRRLALRLHPDKQQHGAGASAEEREASRASFQALQRIYAVLGDAEKRAIYDETGSLQDAEDVFGGGGGGGGGAELYARYRAAFRQVTEDDLVKFAREYRGSDEERADLVRRYTELKGDMSKVFEWVMLSRPGVDDRRFAAAVDAAVAAGDAPRSAAYERWAAKARAAEVPGGIDPLDPEADAKLEAMQQAAGAGGKGKRKKIGGGSGAAGGGDENDGGGMMALVAQIRGRGAGGPGGGGDFLAALEAKYGGKKEAGGGGGSGGRKKKGGEAGAAAEATTAAEPTDEEFEAAAARLAQRKKQKAGAEGAGGGGGAASKKKQQARARGKL